MSKTIDTYTMTHEDLTKHANQVKELFLEQMVGQEMITEHQAERMNRFAIVVSKPSLLGEFWNKLWNKEEGKDKQIAKYVVVKVL